MFDRFHEFGLHHKALMTLGLIVAASLISYGIEGIADAAMRYSKYKKAIHIIILLGTGTLLYLPIYYITTTS